MHDLTTVRFRNPTKNPVAFWLKQQVYKVVIQYAAHKSRQVLVPSHYVADDIARYTRVVRRKLTVTYESADKITGPSAPVINLENKTFIMYVGRPLPHKNLPRLVEAFRQLRATHPDLWLVLVGKQDTLYAALKTSLEKEGLTQVCFTGFVSDNQLRWLYEHSAAYIFPSLSEGFGLPGLEAMQAGAPVVASHATCLPEIYGAAALYFDPLDSSDIATKINQILDDASLRATLIQKGKQQVTKYSWRRMAEETVGIYQKALK